MKREARAHWWHEVGWHVTTVGVWYGIERRNIEADIGRYEAALMGLEGEARDDVMSEISRLQKRLEVAESVAGAELVFERCPTYWRAAGYRVLFVQDERDAGMRHPLLKPVDERVDEFDSRRVTEAHA